MKIFLILPIFLLMISCVQRPPQKIDDSSKPVVEISPVSNSASEKNPFSTNEIVADNRVRTLPPPLSSLFPTPKKEDWKGFRRKENAKRLKIFGFYDLKERQVAKDDLEIRVEQISDLYMRIYKNLGVKQSVFILKRTNGNWSAEVFRNTVSQKSDVEKQFTTKLNAPKSGWKNLWQKLVDNELLTFPDSVSEKVEFGADAIGFITESKVSGIYKFYENAGSGEMREIRHAAKILNIIADEFDLKDFQATKKYEE